MTQGSLDPFRPWVEHPLACADTETDGVNPEEARIVTAYVATIDGSTVVPNHWVLDTGREMPEGAAKVHGYTTERMRAEGSNYEEGVMSIWAALSLAWADGRCVAFFNGCYDLTVLSCEARRLGIEPPEIGPIVDPLILDKHYDRYRKGSRKLVDTARFYNLPMGDAHSADADALAAARLAWKLPRVYPELAEMTADQLQEAQRTWYRDQKLGLIDHFKRVGKSIDDISTDWPVRAA